MMNKTKIRAIVLLSLMLLLSFSCELKKDFYLKGIVINEGNQQPISGAKVYFKDGLESGGFLGGTSPDNYDSTTTDIEGRFELGFKSKSSHGFVSVGKEGYVQQTEDGTIQGVNQGDDINSSMVLKMRGLAYFNPPFVRSSLMADPDNELKITLLSYSNIEKPFHHIYEQVSFRGEGSFYLGEFIDPEVVGDAYLRYLAEFSCFEGWCEKVDSVYLPTSTIVYRDTIYY